MEKQTFCLNMEIPKTTTEKPYIEFRINKKGELIELVTTPYWWGGKNGGFFSTEGYEGNTCKPEDLNKFIEAYKTNKIKKLEKEMVGIQKKINILKTKFNLI